MLTLYKVVSTNGYLKCRPIRDNKQNTSCNVMWCYINYPTNMVLWFGSMGNGILELSSLSLGGNNPFKYSQQTIISIPIKICCNCVNFQWLQIVGGTSMIKYRNWP